MHVDIFLNLFPKDFNLTQFNLTCLIFDCDFNESLQTGDLLPSTLTNLALGDNFNQQLLPGVFPPKLTHLEFGNSFNQPIDPDVLPCGLSYLKFGRSFNQPIKKGVLAITLTCLEFGSNYQQPIELDNLHSLTCLKFGYCFNKPIKAFPKSLKHLQLPVLWSHQTFLINKLTSDGVDIKYVTNYC
jgi:hypothetical protein